MVDECSCDIVPVLAAEYGGLIPYLAKKKSFINYLNCVMHNEQKGLHITSSIIPGVATPCWYRLTG